MEIKDRRVLQSTKLRALTDYKLKYKTELCRMFENGACEFGSKCTFAHGLDELQTRKTTAKNYKTKKCTKFHSLGFCPYGRRCQFIHLTTAASPRKSRLPIFQAIENSGDDN